MNNRGQVLDNKCPNCGAKLDFNPTTGKWKCKYCSSSFSLEQLQNYNNASSLANNTDNIEQKQADTITEKKTQNKQANNIDGYDNYMSYNCPNCGAEVVTDEQTAATFCVYCGNTAILKNKLSGEFSPSKIIPFKKEKEEAIQTFKNLSVGRVFVPKDFTNQNNIEKIRGIYIPFWLHSFKIEGEIKFTGNKYEYWSRGDTDYTRTNIYNIERGGSISFNSVPIDGSTRFDDSLMNTIQPYDYKELVPYNHAYLSGFLAERYDIKSEDTRKKLEDSALNDAKTTFMSTAPNYVHTSVQSNTLKTEDYNVEYVLLPVYMVNIKYLNKMYTFAMNGQTGEFIGNIPVDRKKVIITGIVMFIAIFLLLLLASYIFYLIGGRS